MIVAHRLTVGDGCYLVACASCGRERVRRGDQCAADDKCPACGSVAYEPAATACWRRCTTCTATDGEGEDHVGME